MLIEDRAYSVARESGPTACQRRDRHRLSPCSGLHRSAGSHRPRRRLGHPPDDTVSRHHPPRRRPAPRPRGLGRGRALLGLRVGGQRPLARLRTVPGPGKLPPSPLPRDHLRQRDRPRDQRPGRLRSGAGLRSQDCQGQGQRQQRQALGGPGAPRGGPLGPGAFRQGAYRRQRCLGPGHRPREPAPHGPGRRRAGVRRTALRHRLRPCRPAPRRRRAHRRRRVDPAVGQPPGDRPPARRRRRHPQGGPAGRGAPGPGHG